MQLYQEQITTPAAPVRRRPPPQLGPDGPGPGGAPHGTAAPTPAQGEQADDHHRRTLQVRTIQCVTFIKVYRLCRPGCSSLFRSPLSAVPWTRMLPLSALFFLFYKNAAQNPLFSQTVPALFPLRIHFPNDSPNEVLTIPFSSLISSPPPPPPASPSSPTDPPPSADEMSDKKPTMSYRGQPFHRSAAPFLFR